jgi:hypothetical protein
MVTTKFPSEKRKPTWWLPSLQAKKKNYLVATKFPNGKINDIMAII